MKKFKRILALIGVMTLIAALFAGCGKENSDNSNSGAASSEKTYDLTGVKLLNDGVLCVGEEVGYPPFEDFAEDGTTPIGFDVDIINEIARRLGLKVNIINTSFDGIFAGIGNNYDVVCSACTITDKRKQSMLFSTPYISNYQAVILKAGDTRTISSFNDLDGMTIALQKETTSDELISDYKSTGTIDIEIVANEKVLSCFTQLDNGEVDAVVVDSTVADGYLAKNPDKYIYAYKDEAEAESFGIAIGKENEALKKVIDEVLADMEADGFIKETLEYWFGAE
ncbi:MAG: transporter substrate-binding domain-containing protein [Lachnospiraceae bacterium]|nr:transporter substrate-binding domain-containing protein [Lachnospiraceae bacterium]MBR5993416.1 transporter substrate-binding domain-containing protein [Lachnospiraceae bacterium]